MFGSYYRPRGIPEINKRTDGKVAVIGKVVESGENSFVLEDGVAKVEIVFEGKVEKNKTVRAFCSIAEDQLKADVIQSLDGLDLNLFKRVKELYNKAGL